MLPNSIVLTHLSVLVLSGCGKVWFFWFRFQNRVRFLMGMPLREGLKRLCLESGWSYAVIWKPVVFERRV